MVKKRIWQVHTVIDLKPAALASASYLLSGSAVNKHTSVFDDVYRAWGRTLRHEDEKSVF